MNQSNNLFRLAWRGLLQLDRPVPPRSDEQVAAEVEQNYRWNFAVNLIDSTWFWFGISFASSSTIVPLFISKLTDSTLAIGLVAVLAQGGWLMPQLLSANAIEQLPSKKAAIVNLGFFTERIPRWIPMIAALVAVRSPMLALTIFFIGYTWQELGGGMVAPAWQDLIARCFPVDRRGRFFGLSMFTGTATGTIGAFFSSWLLETFSFPTNFVYIFAIYGLSITLSWVFLSLTREPLQPLTGPRQSAREFWANLPVIIRQDHNFRRFLVARSLFSISYMGAGFVAVAAIHRWEIPNSTVGLYTAAMLLGQALGNLGFGFLSDRFGHKLCLELGALATLAMFAIAWLTPFAAGYYAVFFLSGVHLSAAIVSGILVVMEFCEPHKRPTYIGLTNTINGLVSALAPLLGAWLAGIAYNPLFALCAVVSLVTLVLMHWWVREPRWAEKQNVRKT